MDLFFVPDASGSEVTLGTDESRHLIKVLRYPAGSKVLFTDGQGYCYTSRIVNADSRACTLEILSKEFTKLPEPRLHIGIAPTKNNDRLEWFLEKAVEIGIHSVLPVLCEHGERDAINVERLKKIMIPALKQSQRFWLPEILPFCPLAKALCLFPEAHRFLGHAEGKLSLKNELVKGSDAFILIGPEGDFSLKELELADQNGFKHVSMGKNRLRTETAALVAVTAFSFCNLEK